MSCSLKIAVTTIIMGVERRRNNWKRKGFKGEGDRIGGKREQRVLTFITGVFLSFAFPIAAAAKIMARIEIMRNTMLAPNTMVLSEKIGLD